MLANNYYPMPNTYTTAPAYNNSYMQDQQYNSMNNFYTCYQQPQQQAPQGSMLNQNYAYQPQQQYYAQQPNMYYQQQQYGYPNYGYQQYQAYPQYQQQQQYQTLQQEFDARFAREQANTWGQNGHGQNLNGVQNGFYDSTPKPIRPFNDEELARMNANRNNYVPEPPYIARGYNGGQYNGPYTNGYVYNPVLYTPVEVVPNYYMTPPQFNPQQYGLMMMEEQKKQMEATKEMLLYVSACAFKISEGVDMEEAKKMAEEVCIIPQQEQVDQFGLTPEEKEIEYKRYTTRRNMDHIRRLYYDYHESLITMSAECIHMRNVIASTQEYWKQFWPENCDLLTFLNNSAPISRWMQAEEIREKNSINNLYNSKAFNQLVHSYAATLPDNPGGILAYRQQNSEDSTIGLPQSYEDDRKNRRAAFFEALCARAKETGRTLKFDARR